MLWKTLFKHTLNSWKRTFRFCGSQVSKQHWWYHVIVNSLHIYCVVHSWHFFLFFLFFGSIRRGWRTFIHITTCIWLSSMCYCSAHRHLLSCARISIRIEAEQIEGKRCTAIEFVLILNRFRTFVLFVQICLLLVDALNTHNYLIKCIRYLVRNYLAIEQAEIECQLIVGSISICVRTNWNAIDWTIKRHILMASSWANKQRKL